MTLEGLAFPKFNLSEVIDFYENLVSRSLTQVDKGMFAEALNTIAGAAYIAYLTNWRYEDSRLETALKTISTSLLPVVKPSSASVGKRIVFFDSWGLDARGLSLQYIRALNAIESSILFICESRNEAASIGLREELARGRNTQIIYLDSVRQEVEKARRIHSAIENFQPTQILMHMTPWATGAITALHAFPDTPRYQINLTDHAYWLGTSCSDYSIEFRSYGLTVSQEKRGILPDRTILNPYYPIVQDQHASTLPERKSGEVVVFTGGAFYKFYGRQGYFFSLISDILEEHLNVVVWIAGSGRVTMLEQRLRRYLDTGRVKIIGDRQDINAVFKACDMYLSTYPVTGALMAQLAAANSVPILSFTSVDLVANRLEDIIGNENVPEITCTDVLAFRQRATTLVKDAEKRAAAATLTKDAMHGRTEFERRIAIILTQGESHLPYASKLPNIDYGAFTSMYLEIENYFQDTLARRFLRSTTIRTALQYPLLTTKAAIHVAWFLLMKMISRRPSL